MAGKHSIHSDGLEQSPANYTPLPPLTLLARFGPTWVEALFEHIAPLEDGHLIATILPDEEEGAPHEA